jgi:hypothetical protein
METRATDAKVAVPGSRRIWYISLGVFLAVAVLFIWIGRPILRFYQTPNDRQIRAEMTKLGAPEGQDGSEKRTAAITGTGSRRTVRLSHMPS